MFTIFILLFAYTFERVPGGCRGNNRFKIFDPVDTGHFAKFPPMTKTITEWFYNPRTRFKMEFVELNKKNKARVFLTFYKLGSEDPENWDYTIGVCSNEYEDTDVVPMKGEDGVFGFNLKNSETFLKDEELAFRDLRTILPSDIFNPNSDIVQTKKHEMMENEHDFPYQVTFQETLFTISDYDEKVTTFDGQLTEIVVTSDEFRWVFDTDVLVTESQHPHIEQKLKEEKDNLHSLEELTIDDTLTFTRREYFGAYRDRVLVEEPNYKNLKFVSDTLLTANSRGPGDSDKLIYFPGALDWIEQEKLVDRIERTYNILRKSEPTTLFVITGGVTSNGLESELQLFHWVVRKSGVKPRNILLIPGNEDLYKLHGMKGGDQEKWDRFYDHFYDARNVYAETELSSDNRNMIKLYRVSEDSYILSLNSNSLGNKYGEDFDKGEFYPETKKLLHNVLGFLANSGQKAVMVLHHGFEDWDEDEDLMIMMEKTGKEVIDRVVSGHNHRYFKRNIYKVGCVQLDSVAYSYNEKTEKILLTHPLEEEKEVGDEL